MKKPCLAIDAIAFVLIHLVALWGWFSIHKFLGDAQSIDWIRGQEPDIASSEWYFWCVMTVGLFGLNLSRKSKVSRFAQAVFVILVGLVAAANNFRPHLWVSDSLAWQVGIACLMLLLAWRGALFAVRPPSQPSTMDNLKPLFRDDLLGEPQHQRC